ncbi:MAG: hypothetical protein HWN66_10580 [Candidatus Helarchaeota archaeon]|nr:hypothetical protein [Candidatus Helarchaeota archaeon]
MPYGIIVVRWDDKLGVVVEGLHPKMLKISEDHIMRIFTTHAMGGGEAGFLSMSIENLNVASYYTGLPEEGKTQYYVALLLRDEENADIFEEPLLEVSKLLVDHIKDKFFNQFLAKQFGDVVKLTEMTEEQRYSMIHRDQRRILVLRKLGLGALPKDELRKWLSDHLGEDILDLDTILSPFFKTQMIHELPVETMDGSKTNCIFLIQDVFSMRSPVEKFYKISKDGGAPPEMGRVFQIYKEETDNFFKNYRLGDADSKQIADIVADPNNYNLVTILRNNYIEINQLPDIYEKSLDQIMPQINDMIRHNVIQEIKDKKGNRWIFLKSDIVFPTFFPEYIVDSIRRRWMEKGITQNLALKHLELLKSVYRGEEEKLELPGEGAEKPVFLEQLPPKVPKKEVPVVAAVKVISDEEIFNFVEQVNYLRKEAKIDLDNKNREAAYDKIQEAIKITNDLIAIGAVGQETRLEKLELVAKSVKKLIDKEKVKKPSIPTPAAAPKMSPAPRAPTPAGKPSVERLKLLRKDRDNAIASADKALTAGNFKEAISYLEKAAELSENMGEKEKAAEIRKMASDIKNKLEKLGR